jgi:WD40 repeat protein
MPGHANYVLTAHADGTLVVFDKDKEDAPFVPEDTPTVNKPLDSQKPFLKVLKSVQSQNQKTNPVSFWKLHNSKINAIAFSPDGKTLAVVSEEGRLRLIDFHNERLTDVFNGYVGPLYCVCWSPDGNYILTGGQDADLISIYSFAEKRLIARFKGHKNWVRWIAFDPWRCDERNYRFGSVGDDCQLCLWDFNLGMVHTPRSVSNQQRNSIASGRDEESQSFSDLGEGEAIIHPTVVNVGVPFQPLVVSR